MEELNEIYKYKGLPLQTNSLADAILKLYSGKLAETQTIFQEALKYHKNNGGSDANSNTTGYLFSRAMAHLKSKGIIISNPSTGWWRIGKDIIEENTPLIENHIEPINQDDTKEDVSKYIADIIIGEGNSVVYVYYLPLYRQYAEKQGEELWPCKIGRTDRDPIQRILSQASTALPEKPHVAIIIKTDSPIELENAFHNILSFKGRKIDAAPGTEWYLTSPNEVMAIYEFILPSKEKEDLSE